MSDKSKRMEKIHIQMDASFREMTAAVAYVMEKLLAQLRKEGLDDWYCLSVGRRHAKAFADCADISLRISGHQNGVGEELYDVSEIKRQRNELLGIIEGLIDAWRSGDNLDPLLDDARDAELRLRALQRPLHACPQASD